MQVSQAIITNEIDLEYSGTEHETEKKILANAAMQEGLAWMRMQPSADETNMTRGEIRRKRRGQRQALYDHVHKAMNPSENPHAVGFIIPMIIFELIAETVFSWICWKILDKYFG